MSEKGMKFDGGKVRFSLIDPIFHEEMAKLLTVGAEKYAANSWQDVENPEERYLDALMRHLNAYQQGEEHDAETGASHLVAVAINAMFLEHFRRERKNEACK